MNRNYVYIKKIKVGMVTIGQSPRNDVTSDIKDILGPKIETIECGALDELTLEDVKKLEPKRENTF